jgi:hypothetical protein
MIQLIVATLMARTFALDVPARPVVEIEGLAGDVAIEAGGDGRVSVRATVEGQGWSASAEPTAAGASIRATCGEQRRPRSGRCGRGGVRLHVTVPADADVRVLAVRGGISVAGVRGPLSLEALDGEVSIESAPHGRALMAAVWRASGRLVVRALAALQTLL